MRYWSNVADDESLMIADLECLVDRGPRVMELCYLSWIFTEKKYHTVTLYQGGGMGFKAVCTPVGLSQPVCEAGGGGLTGAIQH